MQRVDAEDHPLSSSYPQYLSASNSSDTNRSPAASLIQSAARSVLDDATPTTTVSDDDESESCSCADGTLGYSRPGASPTLSSLQIKTMPALPDEQDRKRFVGCLAAILASAYEYDEPDDSPGEKNPYAYVDFAEQYDDMDQNSAKANPILNTRSSSFEYGDTDENDLSEPSGNSSQQPLKQAQSTSLWGVNAKTKAKLAASRHRRRRYDILSKLLIDSSELLLLERSVARAFLPMLARVLVPQPKPKTSSRPPLHQPKKTKGRPSSSRSAPVSPAEKGRSSPPRSSSFMEGDAEVPEIASSHLDITGGERGYLPRELDEQDILRPFLEGLTAGAGIRCVSLLLLQYLLTSQVGYDSRIRHVMKKLGVIVLVHDMERDPVEHVVVGDRRDPKAYKALVARATRKYESLEHSVARRLIRLSESDPNAKKKKGQQDIEQTKAKNSGITREQIVRGVKIGGVGIVAGTIFALTGGLAAPGIAAGVAAVAGSAAATAAVVTLTSTAVVTTIFGVGGGTLAAYKMQRRTEGLTEFEFQKETSTHTGDKNGEGLEVKSNIEAELFSTICVSGWLRDNYDYQRPWGLHPTNPRLMDRMELLERFYSIHSPDHVPKCARILASWKGEERKLWAILREKYGRDPDHLFPLESGPRFVGGLTLEQEEVLDQLFVELGYNSAAPNRPKPAEKQTTPFERMRAGWKDRKQERGASKQPVKETKKAPIKEYDSVHGPFSTEFEQRLALKNSAMNSSGLEGMSFAPPTIESQEEFEPPEHLATVWDYKTTYGGELYTVRWESELLKKICDCVMDLAMDVVSGATRHILKQTVLSTLLAAIVWPSYLVNVANMIDGDWTLAVERADEAGKELARTLLGSRAGHRPVTLVGFSFGGRIIYACLKELAKYQEEWEELQEALREKPTEANDKHRLAKLKAKFEGMREPSSIVEDAVLMGLPNHLSLLSWKACRQMVAGRLVNCYSRKDLILSLMFQAKRFSGNLTTGGGSILKPVCGTCPVLVPGVENFDVSDIVSGHQDYCLVTGEILERVRLGQPLRSASNDADLIQANLTEATAKKLEY